LESCSVMTGAMIIKRADTNELHMCLRIRREVFIEEQQVPEELELDEYDATALHFIALDGMHPVATARVLLKEGGKTAKIGRVAVLKQARGSGIGKNLMQFLEKAPDLAHVSSFVLEAQTHALAFYERLGYRAHGEEFMDAGIPHFHMKKTRT